MNGAKLLLTLLVCTSSLAAAQPASATHFALLDGTSLPPGIAPQVRYLDVSQGGEELWAATVFVLNTAVSRTNVDYVPTHLPEANLVRIDLAALAPDAEDFVDLVNLWESLSVDEPYYHVPVFDPNGNSVSVEVEVPYLHFGDEFTSRRSFLPAPHLGEAALALSELTGSVAPILDARDFIVTVMTTADKGRYYDFRDLPNGTILEDYLISRGASEVQVAGLDSDERAGIIRSQVTGKPRSILMFRGAGVRPSVGTGLVTITNDPFDEDIDPERDPIRTLQELEDRGAEVILEMKNGWHEFTIFNEAREIVKEAPPNLVSDHLIPAPFTKRLQPAISCVRCHGADVGWRPFENHVQVLLTRQLDIFADLSTQGGIPDSLRRLSGLYSGDLSEPLRLARDSYTVRTTKTTGKTVPEVSEAVAKVYSDYVYDLVTPMKALRELGVPVGKFEVKGEGGGALLFTQLIPPLPPGEDGIAPEDPIIAILREPTLPGINRTQFKIIFPDLATRLQATILSALPQGEVPIAEVQETPEEGAEDDS